MIFKLLTEIYKDCNLPQWLKTAVVLIAFLTTLFFPVIVFKTIVAIGLLIVVCMLLIFVADDLAEDLGKICLAIVSAELTGFCLGLCFLGVAWVIRLIFLTRL